MNFYNAAAGGSPTRGRPPTPRPQIWRRTSLAGTPQSWRVRCRSCPRHPQIYRNLLIIEIHRKLWKLIEICRNLQKFIEIYRNLYKFITSNINSQKFIEIHGNLQKFMEIYRNSWKIFKFIVFYRNSQKFKEILKFIELLNL